MKIAIILEAVFPENKGGLERWYGILSNYLADAGHDVIYLNSRNINEIRNNVTYESLSANSWTYLKGGSRSKLQAFKFATEVRNWLKFNKVDAIYMSSVPILSIFAASIFRKKNRIPRVIEWFEIWSLKYWVSYAGILIGLIGWLVQTLSLLFGVKVIAFTNLMANRAKEFRRKPHSVILMPGMCSDEVDVSNFFNQNRENIVFIGRLVEEKQPMLAIKAVERFISEGWSGFFHIVGTGPLSIDIQKYLDNSMYSSKIVFIENPDDARVKRLLMESFVILHPSRREGYGLVLIEAAYAGTASIIINYPENASTELGIHPTLICSDDKIDTIVGNLKASYVDQVRLRQITEEWVRNASINRTYRESCLAIEHLLKEIGSN